MPLLDRILTMGSVRRSFQAARALVLRFPKAEHLELYLEADRAYDGGTGPRPAARRPNQALWRDQKMWLRNTVASAGYVAQSTLAHSAPLNDNPMYNREPPAKSISPLQGRLHYAMVTKGTTVQNRNAAGTATHDKPVKWNTTGGSTLATRQQMLQTVRKNLHGGHHRAQCGQRV